jgi:NAD(P)-dependent dehydrogenase (short-subunit alcohol dehydrogenase family)
MDNSARISASDLTQRPPRSPRCRLGGYVTLPRMLDKSRATMMGKNGEFKYNAPFDQHIINFLGLDPAALLKQLAAGKGDAEIFQWIGATGATSSVRGGGWLAFSSAKFALRGLVQSLARELWPQGVHVAQVVVDGIIGPAGAAAVGGEPRLDPDHTAEGYWHLARQRPTAWTLELDLRPHGEKFFE